MFVHQDPALVPGASGLSSANPAPKKLSPQDIKAAQLLALDEELGEERVAAYRSRMMKELEEIRYRQWRDLQPEWEKVATIVAENSNPAKPQSASVLSGPLTGAVAVAAGTAGVRYQLGQIQDQLNGNDDSGDDGSGIADFFSGLF